MSILADCYKKADKQGKTDAERFRLLFKCKNKKTKKRMKGRATAKRRR